MPINRAHSGPVRSSRRAKLLLSLLVRTFDTSKASYVSFIGRGRQKSPLGKHEYPLAKDHAVRAGSGRKPVVGLQCRETRANSHKSGGTSCAPLPRTNQTTRRACARIELRAQEAEKAARVRQEFKFRSGKEPLPVISVPEDYLVYRLENSRTSDDQLILRKMLPLLAMLVTGFMAKQAGGAAGQATEGGGLGRLIGGLGGLFGGGGASAPSAAGAGGLGGLGGLAAMLDANGDGPPLDDILRKLGKG